MPKLPVHVQTHKEAFDRNQRVRAMHRKTAEVRSRLSRVNQITHRSAHSTNEIDSNLVQEHQSRIDTEPTVARAASLDRQPDPHFGDVFGSVPLPPAFILPPTMALHSAPYARVHSSVIGKTPPSQTSLGMTVRKRKARKDKGLKHKSAAAIKPRRCLTCVRNCGPNIYAFSG